MILFYLLLLNLSLGSRIFFLNLILSGVTSTSSSSAISLTRPKTLTLEEALEFIAEDELVEVTPDSIRLRKKILDPKDRFRSNN